MRVEPISIGNGIEAYLKVDLKRFKARFNDFNIKDNDEFVYVKVGNFIDISDSEERVVSPNYIPGSRTAVGFSCGLEQGGGRIIAETFDKDVCNYIIKTIINDKTTKSKTTNFNENITATSGTVNKKEVKKTTISLDEVSIEALPIFDLVLLAKGSALRNIVDGKNSKNLYKKIETNGAGVIFQKIIEKVKIISSASGLESEMGFSAEVYNFIYFGNNIGWDKSDNKEKITFTVKTNKKTEV